MKRLLVGLFSALLCMTILAIPSSASAETCVPGTNICEGGDIRHYSPDEGYDAAIIVFCNWGAPWDNRKFVTEGSTSKDLCGVDTDEVYVRDDEEIWCRVPVGVNQTLQFVKIFDQAGRHKIDDAWSSSCVVQRD